VSEAWTSGKLDRRLLGEWMKQHYHYVSHFAEWVAAVYANCPHPDVQHFLLENVTEEEGLVGMHGARRCAIPTCCWSSARSAA